MKLPGIDQKEPYDYSTFLQWIERNNTFDVAEENKLVRAIYIPCAKNEQYSRLIMQALAQITDLSAYSCVLAISTIKGNTVENGIFLPQQGEPFSTAFRDIDVTIPDAVTKQLETLEKPVCYDSLKLLPNSELDFTLPLLIEKFQNLPIVPLLYKKCSPNSLLKIMTTFYNYKALIVIIGQMSHSLSVDEVKSLDSSTFSKIIALDDTVDSSQSNAYIPLNALIKIGDMKFLRPKILSYQILEAELIYVNQAGCASIVFYKN